MFESGHPAPPSVHRSVQPRNTQSRGTFATIVGLVGRQKPVLLDLSATRTFRRLHARSDLLGLLDEAPPQARSRLEPLIDGLKARPLWQAAASAVLF